MIMNEERRIVTRGASGRLVEKASEFIADVMPVHTEEEAAAFIESIRKKYYDARHHCYAYILNDGVIRKSSDDGEPSQTAGKPMMDILENMGLTDVCAVVTRYFGGTLLGTGGLVRAYSGALKDGLEHCEIAEVASGSLIRYSISYDLYGKISHMSESGMLYIMEQEFAQDVTVSLLVREEDCGKTAKNIENISAGRAKLLDITKAKYIIVKDKPQIL
jgi:uncharacterized YigZ family protein